MSNERSASVKQKLIELLESSDKVQRAFLLVDTKAFKASLSINNRKETMSLGNGNFVVLMLSDDSVEGMSAGIYDPESPMSIADSKSVS